MKTINLKYQVEIDNSLEIGKEYKNYPVNKKIYALVKKSGHFECQMHTRKTLDGIIKMIRKGFGYTKGADFVVYELPFIDKYIIYDSNKRINNCKDNKEIK